MADTIKCPNCGSNLTLNADTQKLECPSCGASFDPASLNTITVDELEAKQAEPTDPSQEPHSKLQRPSRPLRHSRKLLPSRLNSSATPAVQRS